MNSIDKDFTKLMNNEYPLPNSYFLLLLEVEGGLSDHPNDRGGRTKYGLTQNLINRIGSKYGIKYVDDLTLDIAYKVYNYEFWDKWKCYLYPDKLDYVIFDSFVNHGNRGARYRLKEFIYRLKQTLVYDNDIQNVITDLKQIDKLNYQHQQQTILNYYFNQTVNPLLLADELLLIRMNFYYRFIVKYRNQKVFIEGWIRRLKVIMDKLPDLKK